MNRILVTLEISAAKDYKNCQFTSEISFCNHACTFSLPVVYAKLEWIECVSMSMHSNTLNIHYDVVY